MLAKAKATASTVGVFLEAESKARAAVDTGHLRRSISHQTNVTPTLSSVFFGTNVEYAPIVELGSINQQAQPYLIPSITENLATLQKMIQEGMRV